MEKEWKERQLFSFFLKYSLLLGLYSVGQSCNTFHYILYYIYIQYVCKKLKQNFS